MNVFEEYSIKSKINRLARARNDLRDDADSINDINNKINNIIWDVQSFIQTGSGNITSKLDMLKEPYQYNDGNLTTAVNYIQREINYQDQLLKNGSGGGSW